jgi:UV excision repair protein RAD23
MQQIRELMAQNPALLQGLIQQLGESNPGLANQLATNPEMLLQVLAAASGEGLEDEEGGIPQGAQVVQLTPDEMQAVQRVSQIQIFKAGAVCDKV